MSLDDALKKMTGPQKSWIKIYYYNNDKNTTFIADHVSKLTRIKVNASEIENYLSNEKRNKKQNQSVVKPSKNKNIILTEKNIPDELTRPIQSPDDYDTFLKRIEFYSKSSIQKQLSEAETIDILVKPLLRLLGWNFENPLEVQQNTFGGGDIKGGSQPDIVLGKGRDNAIIVEVKAMKKSIVKKDSKPVQDVYFQYEKYHNSKQHKHKYIVVTNGRHIFILERKDEVLVRITSLEDFKNKRSDIEKYLSRQSVLG